MQRLGIEVGDEITAEINREPVDLRVVGWYSETEDSGDVLQLPLETLRTVDPDADPGGFFVRLADGADTGRIVEASRRSWATAHSSFRTSPESRRRSTRSGLRCSS